MIKKMAAAGIVASVFSFGFFASPSAQARGHGSWGHHSSYSSPSSHSSYQQPHSYAQAPHATAPMAPPVAAAAKPSILGTIATTAAGTAGGVVAGNAISSAFEGHGENKDAKSDDKSSQPSAHQISEEASAVPVVAGSAGNGALQGLPQQAGDPCTAENEAKNPRIEELCGQLHQELRKVNDSAKEQAAAQK
ncbi:DUF2076 family protein [Acetobacteraceae bacterium]|nr:DUF2076 family protein [Acetobacteraceae bacterium]